MLTRREFFGVCGALAGASLFGGIGCGAERVYEVSVSDLDDGQSVYQATARYHRLTVDARTKWNREVLPGSRKVVAIDGVASDRWVFEIDGRRFAASADAADVTRVRVGQVIAWRMV